MDIQIINEPFPHLIIDNVYTEDELKRIWQELDFLTYPEKVDTVTNMQVATDMITQEPKANNTGYNFDEIYRGRRQISDILTYNRKIFNKEITEAVKKLSPCFADYQFINRDYTKIRYYDDGQEYAPHFDTARYTVCTYFYKDKSKIRGGNLEFPDFNHKIETKNNRAIFFTGCITHAATPSERIDEAKPFDGYGRYCMNQFLDYADE